MPEGTNGAQWDDHFTPERGRTVTLRDDKGTLYCIQAHYLAQVSTVFADMFACVPPNADPIEADFRECWIKPFLLYITPSPTQDFFTVFKACGVRSMTRLQLWCLQYDCPSVLPHVEEFLAVRLFSNDCKKHVENLVMYFKMVGGQRNMVLLEKGCIAVQRLLAKSERSMELVTGIDEALPEEWKGAFIKAVLEHKLSRKPCSVWQCFSKQIGTSIDMDNTWGKTGSGADRQAKCVDRVSTSTSVEKARDHYKAMKLDVHYRMS